MTPFIRLAYDPYFTVSIGLNLFFHFKTDNESEKQ